MTRLAEHGFATVDERETTCCYARQDKFWVQNTPNGEQWEIYTVLVDSPTFSAPPEDNAAGCCSTQKADTPEAAASCC